MRKHNILIGLIIVIVITLSSCSDTEKYLNSLLHTAAEFGYHAAHNGLTLEAMHLELKARIES